MIGEYTVDDLGRLLEPTITKKVLGFVKPKIRDESGTGGLITPIYSYSGPRKLKESNVLDLQTYIDCVGHPYMK